MKKKLIYRTKSDLEKRWLQIQFHTHLAKTQRQKHCQTYHQQRSHSKQQETNSNSKGRTANKSKTQASYRKARMYCSWVTIMSAHKAIEVVSQWAELKQDPTSTYEAFRHSKAQVADQSPPQINIRSSKSLHNLAWQHLVLRQIQRHTTLYHQRWATISIRPTTQVTYQVAI